MTRDPVRATLAGAGLAALAAAPFLLARPDRLRPGHAVALAALPPALAVVAALPFALLLALALAAPSRVRAGASPVLAALAVAAIPLAAALGARTLAGWIGLGGGFFASFACACFAFGQGGAARPRTTLLLAALLAAGFAGAAASGLFGGLSIAREFAGRRAAVADATLRHAALAGVSTALAALTGLPLGIAAARRPRLAPPVFAVLNTLQTIPSIAAFGLLLAPLSALAAAVPLLGRLGVAGIGPAPAVIALTGYALLPIARNTAVGLAGIDPAIRDAAAGMGFSARRRLFAVELPLAAPTVIAGLRVAAVQTIGLATVAALIGAGGLGAFVFRGIGEYATDLVLLGALPVLGMALAADAAFAGLERLARGRSR